MKNIISIIALILFVGCASAPKTAGKFLATTAKSADLGMQGWATLVALGKATPQQEATVRAIYAKYQLSMSVGTNAYMALVLNKDTNSWVQAQQAILASSGSLLTLISVFTSTNR